jgi:hypothetical protein
MGYSEGTGSPEKTGSPEETGCLDTCVDVIMSDQFCSFSLSAVRVPTQHSTQLKSRLCVSSICPPSIQPSNTLMRPTNRPAMHRQCRHSRIERVWRPLRPFSTTSYTPNWNGSPPYQPNQQPIIPISREEPSQLNTINHFKDSNPPRRHLVTSQLTHRHVTHAV